MRAYWAETLRTKQILSKLTHSSPLYIPDNNPFTSCQAIMRVQIWLKI
jgi:hypothetical protein